MKKVIDRIVKELENVSYFTESTYDEDGYSNDDSEEVINLYRATEIVKKVLEEHYIARQDRVNGKIIGNQQCLDKLGQLEDAEEKGLLLRLPCKVGDTVWWLNGKFLMECEIESFVVDEDGVSFAHIRYLHDKKHNRYYGHNLDIEKLGIIWFLTKEEAEQMKAGGKNE